MTAPRSILLIEDDPDHQLLARLHLEPVGHHVEVVSSLHDALALLDVADDLFDVIVVDLNLPDHDGAHTLEMLGDVTKAPVVVWSAGAAERLERTIEQGAVAAVSKSDPTRLSEIVDQLTERSGRLHGASPASTEGVELIDFHGAARQVVDWLAAADTLTTWIVTRVVEDDWVILAVHDENYDFVEGQVLRWEDSICCRMVEGRGPRIVPDTTAQPVYNDAPIARELAIGAYVGVPLLEGGRIFGTLCGAQPEPHPDPGRLHAVQPLLELLVATLSVALSLDLDRARLQRRVDVADAAARTDLLTGLGNRRSWEHALRAEEARSARFGHLAGVAIIDLNGLKAVNDRDGHAAGDDLIRRTATAITSVIRSNDLAFRLGGDEFGILLPESGHDNLDALTERLRSAFAASGIDAAIGTAVRHGTEDLWAAVQAADRAMYDAKSR